MEGKGSGGLWVGRCMDEWCCCAASPHFISFISIAAVGDRIHAAVLSPPFPQYSQSVAVSRSSALAFSTPAWSPRRYLPSATWRTATLL